MWIETVVYNVLINICTECVHYDDVVDSVKSYSGVSLRLGDAEVLYNTRANWFAFST